MNMKNRVAIPVACMAIALSYGCQQKEESAPSAPQPQIQVQAQTGSAFSALLPPALAGKAIAPGGKANLDALNKNNADAIINVRSEDGFDINGWAFDEKTKSAPEMVFIELSPVNGGEKYYAAASRRDRDDLAKTFNVPAYKKAAYILNADIKSVPPGEYQISVIQIIDENPVVASTNKKMNKTN